MKRAFLVAAVALVATISFPQAAAAPAVEAAVWGAPGAPVEAAPGDNAVPLSLSIRNADGPSYQNVRAVLGSVPGITPIPGGETATLTGTFASGDVWVAKFYVNLASSAAVNVGYTLPVTVYETMKGTSNPIENPLSATVVLTGRPDLQVASDPASLAVGDEKAVNLNVTNAGNGPASGVAVTLAPGSGIGLVRSGNTFSVGSIAAGETKTVHVTLRASGTGAATLGATLGYANAAGAAVQATRTLYFDVLNATPSALEANYLWSDIQQGASGTLALQIHNAGTTNASSVSVGAVPSQGSPLASGGTSTRYLGGLAAGESKEADFSLLSTSATADTAQVDVTISWQTADGALHSRTSTQAMRIATPTRADVAVSLKEDHLDSGRAGTLSFSVVNNQSAAIRGLSFSFQPATTSTAYTVLAATDAQALGTLDVGQSVDAVVRVLTSNSATGIQNLKVQLQWQAVDGSTRTQSYTFGIAILGTVDFQVSAPGGSFDSASGAGTVTGTLTNLGNAIAHNAYVSIGPGGLYQPTQQTYLGDINPNSALPFTLATTLTNTSILASGAGAQTRPFPGGVANGTFGNGGTPPANGSFQGGGNRSGGGRGGGFGGRNASNLTVMLQWNDEYGTVHSGFYSVALTPRAASAPTTSARASAVSTTVGVPLTYVWIGLGALAAAGLATFVVIRRRRLREELED